MSMDEADESVSGMALLARKHEAIADVGMRRTWSTESGSGLCYSHADEHLCQNRGGIPFDSAAPQVESRSGKASYLSYDCRIVHNKNIIVYGPASTPSTPSTAPPNR